MGLNKKIIFLIIFFLIFILIFTFHKNIILYLTKQQLKKIFTESSIAIDNCHLNPFSQLNFYNIEIKKENSYYFKIDKLNISYSIPFLFKKRISAIKFNNLTSKIEKLPPAFLESNTFKSDTSFKVDNLQISGLNIDFKANNISFEMYGFLDLDLQKNSINNLKIIINNFNIQNLKIPKVSITNLQKNSECKITIEKVIYDKIEVEDIFWNLNLENKLAKFIGINGKIFDGKISGNGFFHLDSKEYKLYLKFTNIDVERLVKSLKLDEKFNMEGRWQGIFEISGISKNFKKIDGNFSATQGKLTILDKKFLEEIAKRKNMQLEILVERFKDYNYNRANMDISFVGKDLILGIFLEGEKGKSNLEVVLHDFVDLFLNIIKISGGAR